MTTEKRQQQQQQATGAKNAKRKKRRRKNKKKDETVNNTGGAPEDRVILRDTGEWIDVEDAAPTNNGPQHPALDLSTSGEPNDCTSLSNGDRMISLAHDFPPLTSTFLENGNSRVDPLASYASILQRSLEMNDDGANDSMKQAAQFFDDHDEEMDISDDENEVQLKQYYEAYDGGEETSATHKMSSDSTVNGDDFPPTILHQTQEMHAVEKRALKLAELKAKAKLARAKLRLAEEKKARGQRAMELPDSTEVASCPSTSPVPDSLPDGIAARDESPLDEDIMRSAPVDDVRFVNSEAQATTSTPHATLVSEEKGLKAKSLKQKLHLARLKLEIKKKELEKKELEMKKQAHSSGGFDNHEIEANYPPGISLNVDAAAEQINSEPTEIRDKKH